MDIFVLLACAGCAFSRPEFVGWSTVAGIAPVTYLALRPYTRLIDTWGMPRINRARLVSLLLMLVWLVPVWHNAWGRIPTLNFVLGMSGLVSCCVYLWLRCCWLLEAHRVSTVGRELLFPGLLTPLFFLLGQMVGRWVLGMFLVVPDWPMILVPFTFETVIIVIPVALLLEAGLRRTFSGCRGVLVAQGSRFRCSSDAEHGRTER